MAKEKMAFFFFFFLPRRADNIYPLLSFVRQRLVVVHSFRFFFFRRAIEEQIRISFSFALILINQPLSQSSSQISGLLRDPFPFFF